MLPPTWLPTAFLASLQHVLGSLVSIIGLFFAIAIALALPFFAYHAARRAWGLPTRLKDENAGFAVCAAFFFFLVLIPSADREEEDDGVIGGRQRFLGTLVQALVGEGVLVGLVMGVVVLAAGVWRGLGWLRGVGEEDVDEERLLADGNSYRKGSGRKSARGSYGTVQRGV